MKNVAAILLILIGLLSAVDVQARKVRTTRRNVNERTAVVSKPDSLILHPDTTQARLYGYDKPLRSRRESVFVSNMTDCDATAVSISTQYIDSKGRVFHQSTQRIYIALPAGETRKIDYPSWDTQQSFYYVGSRRSRSAGTPYHVRQSVDTLFVVGGNSLPAGQ